jgi:hypothetical protein
MGAFEGAAAADALVPYDEDDGKDDFEDGVLLRLTIVGFKLAASEALTIGKLRT